MFQSQLMDVLSCEIFCISAKNIYFLEGHIWFNLELFVVIELFPLVPCMYLLEKVIHGIEKNRNDFEVLR